MICLVEYSHKNHLGLVGGLCDWFLSKTLAEQVKWSVAYVAAKVEKEEKNLILWSGWQDINSLSAHFPWDAKLRF